MTESTKQARQRIVKTLAPLASMFPNWHPTEMTYEVYVRVLKDIDPENLDAAIAQLCSENREFMPVAGAIRDVAFTFQAEAEGLPTPYEAWEEVHRARINIGSWRTPEFSHPLIEKTVKTLGWKNLCASTNDVSERARFIDSYERFKERNEKDRRMLPSVSKHIAKLENQLSADRKRLPEPEKEKEDV